MVTLKKKKRKKFSVLGENEHYVPRPDPSDKQVRVALAGQFSGLECQPDTPKLCVWSPVRAHTRSN